MNFSLPKTLGWWIEATTKEGKNISKEYRQKDYRIKEDAKKQFLEDTGYSENEFSKLEVYDAII